MKKNKILIIVLALCVISGIILAFMQFNIFEKDSEGKLKFVFEKKHSSLKALRDFAVEDTASISKIFLVDKANNEILLERISSDEWKLNSNYYARYDLMNVLLGTLKRLEVARPVLKAKQEYVIRELSTKGVKCEIYQDDELAKVMYIGGVTQNSHGTYMYLEGSSEPFVIEIPGFNGYLTTRFNTSLKEWRSRMIYSYQFDEIKSLNVDFPSKPESSYKIENLGANNFKLVDVNGNMVANFDTVAVKTQLGRFKKVGFEFLVEEELSHKLDSINKIDPSYSFTIEDQFGHVKELKCYPRPNVSKMTDEEGVLLPTDIERLYGVIDNDLIVMQYFLIDPMVQELSALKN